MENAIFYPMAVQGALTFSVLLLLLRRRVKALYAKQMRLSYYRLFPGGEPEDIAVVQRSFLNQFEIPVLFYMICVMAAVLGKVDMTMLYAAWAYAGLRVLHAAVHIYNNNVRWRATIFLVSCTVLLFMWIWVGLP